MNVLKSPLKVSVMYNIIYNKINKVCEAKNACKQSLNTAVKLRKT